MLAAAAARDPLAMDLRATSVALTGSRILRLLSRAATKSDRAEATVAGALTREWNVGARGADVVRAALVLCSDHELNVSSFTARCVASAGSHPYAVVIAGLAALEGPKHGGASARVESMLESMRRAYPLRGAVGARLRRGEPIDGFGHPLYRDGDPRARLLLDLLGERYAKSAEYRFVTEFAQAATSTTGEDPNVDLDSRPWAVCSIYRRGHPSFSLLSGEASAGLDMPSSSTRLDN
jgi:citrate synthase